MSEQALKESENLVRGASQLASSISENLYSPATSKDSRAESQRILKGSEQVPQLVIDQGTADSVKQLQALEAKALRLVDENIAYLTAPVDWKTDALEPRNGRITHSNAGSVDIQNGQIVKMEIRHTKDGPLHTYDQIKVKDGVVVSYRYDGHAVYEMVPSPDNDPRKARWTESITENGKTLKRDEFLSEGIVRTVSASGFDTWRFDRGQLQWRSSHGVNGDKSSVKVYQDGSFISNARSSDGTVFEMSGRLSPDRKSVFYKYELTDASAKLSVKEKRFTLFQQRIGNKLQ